MLFNHLPGGSVYQESIGEGMILRTVRDERDIDRYTTFHATYEKEVEGIICNYLLHHHPEISYDDFLLVEDEHTGKVVSTVCLIPWHCHYEDVTMEVAMLEMVFTHPEYRHRGYIRAQINRFHQMVNKRHFDLSIIQGIPYYYRQYGYTYAIDLQGADSLPAWLIPNLHDSEQYPYKLRKAVADDAPILARLYQESMTAVQLHIFRNLDYWQFLLQWMQYPVQVVEDQRYGRTVGYVCIDKQTNNKSPRILESAITNQDIGMFILRQLKAEGAREIQLGGPQTNTLVQIGRSFGSTPLPAHQWLLRIPDIAGLLSKISPVLEHRIATSAFAGFTGDICINLFREASMLHFKQGKLLKVDSVGFVDTSMGADGGDLRIPLDGFVRLVFGYRQLDEMRDVWPDIGVKSESRYLINVLFPKMTSFFCMPWRYYGPTTMSSGQS